MWRKYGISPSGNMGVSDVLVEPPCRLVLLRSITQARVAKSIWCNDVLI